MSTPSSSSYHPLPTEQEASPAVPPPSPPLHPRLAALEAKKAALASKLATLQSQRTQLILDAQRKASSPTPAPMAPPAAPAAASLDGSPRSPHGPAADQQHIQAAQKAVQQQISRLQRYNAVKDVGQGLMGLVAERRGVRVGRVMAEFGVGPTD